MFAATGSELYYSLNMNVQGFELLLKDALRHPPAEVLDQQPHAAVLREQLCVQNRTFLPDKGP
jgi:hypothetical protein